MRNFSKIVTIGDSIIDTGRGASLIHQICALPDKPIESYDILPESFYWEGRISNGKNYMDHVSEKMGVPIENYAVWGGYSGHGNLAEWVDLFIDTGGLGQVGDYLIDHDFTVNEDVLHFINLGSNDPFALVEDATDEEIAATAHETAMNIMSIVFQIVQSGGKYFAIGLMDMTPFDIMADDKDSTIQKFIAVERKDLTEAIAEIKEEVGEAFQYIIIDNLVQARHMVENKDEYGFKEMVLPYIQSEDNFRLSFDTIPDDHVYWDEYHFTKKTHQIWSEFIYNELNKL